MPWRPSNGRRRHGNEVTIKARESGPYLVRGPVTLTDADGNRIHRARPQRRALPLRRIADQAVLRRNAQDQRFHGDGARAARRSEPEASRANAVVRSRGLRFRTSATFSSAAPTADSMPKSCSRPRASRASTRCSTTCGRRRRRSTCGRGSGPRSRLDRQRAAAQPALQDARRCRSRTTTRSTSRTPLLGNDDIPISVAQADRPMEYFYRNTGGDELLFIHHGAGVLETQFGELAYRERDYLVVPTGTTYRVLPASPTRMLVHESTRQRNDSAAVSQRVRSARRARAVLRARFSRAGAQGAGRSARRIRNPRHQRRPQRDLRRAESSLRRRRLGRLLLSLRVQRRRVRADHRQAAPAAAGARDLRSAGSGLLRVRAAAVRLSSAGNSGALQPLQRRLRRSARTTSAATS